MQGTNDMTLESQTTAAGLDAWLAGAVPTTAPAPAAAATAPELGPINAAEAFVLGKVTAARKLVGSDGVELVVDPENDAYYFESTSLKPLKPLLLQAPDQWIPVYTEALKSVRAASAAQPLERLRWFAGLIATPGILSRRLRSGARFKLAHWPETEREFPRHFRIATAMLKAAAPAAAIAAASDATLDEVIDYINACDAAGRLENAAPAAGTAATPHHAARSKGSLLARLNRPLFAR